MNAPSNFTDEHFSREWTAQERALRSERADAASGDDERVEQYRFIARVLRQSPIADLPADFAREVAARADAALAYEDQRLEIVLQRLLLVLLFTVGAAFAVMGGDIWRFAFSAMSRFVAGFASNWQGDWILVAAICLAITWAIERRRERLLES